MSSVHKADDVRIFHKECLTLAKAGYAVTLIARADRDGMRDGVKVLAVQSGSRNRFTRMTKTVWCVLRLAVAEKADIYHFHDPELIPVGLALKALRKRVVYDVHENVPKDIKTKPWIPALLRHPLSLAASVFLRTVTKVFDAVVVATPGIAEVFPGSDPTLVQNFPLLKELVDVTGSAYMEHGDRPPHIVYIGGISELRGIRQMVNALEHLPSQPNVRLMLGGTFAPPALEAQVAREPGWERVDMLGWMSRADVMNLFTQARAGLVLFQPAPNHTDSQPNKLFEYMAAGLPVIASNFPGWNKLVSELQCGMVVDPTDSQEIGTAISWMVNHSVEAQAMGARGRHAVIETYNWEREAKKLLDLYSAWIPSR